MLSAYASPELGLPPNFRDVKQMWRHVEPQKLYESSLGKTLQEADSQHLDSCELCQALLAFFEEQINESDSESRPKAA